MIGEIFRQLGLALLLGLLVGLQRERTEGAVAGIRTFPLITVLGTMTALLAERLGGWLLAAGLLGIAGMFIFANFIRLRSGHFDAGMTTEVAALVMYGVGAYLVIGSAGVAVAVGGVVATLLHWKQPLHRWAGRLGEEDLKAIMQFVLITLVILPVLPNARFGPYGVWNPYRIWLLVVLIVAVSLTGYVAYKLFGQRRGALLNGLLGGLISSTATTVTYARQTAGHAGIPALVIMLASTVVFARVLLLIGVTAREHFPTMAGPLALMLGWCALVCAAAYVAAGRQPAEPFSQPNPAQLKMAVGFGALYALVILAVAVAKEQFGTRGLYVVAMLSGLTDMDAITLSTAQLVQRGQLDNLTGGRAILLASLANLVFKTGIVLALGSPALRRQMGLWFGLAFAGGVVIWWAA